MEPLKIRQNEWFKIVEKVRERCGQQIPIWNCVINYYSVCIHHLVSDLSIKLWSLHRRIAGTRNETYESFNNLPAFWVDTCETIDMEIDRIDRIKANQAQHEQKKLIRALRNGK